MHGLHACLFKYITVAVFRIYAECIAPDKDWKQLGIYPPLFGLIGYLGNAIQMTVKQSRSPGRTQSDRHVKPQSASLTCKKYGKMQLKSLLIITWFGSIREISLIRDSVLRRPSDIVRK